MKTCCGYAEAKPVSLEVWACTMSHHPNLSSSANVRSSKTQKKKTRLVGAKDCFQQWHSQVVLHSADLSFLSLNINQIFSSLSHLSFVLPWIVIANVSPFEILNIKCAGGKLCGKTSPLTAPQESRKYTKLGPHEDTLRAPHLRMSFYLEQSSWLWFRWRKVIMVALIQYGYVLVEGNMGHKDTCTGP